MQNLESPLKDSCCPANKQEVPIHSCCHHGWHRDHHCDHSHDPRHGHRLLGLLVFSCVHRHVHLHVHPHGHPHGQHHDQHWASCKRGKRASTWTWGTHPKTWFGRRCFQNISRRGDVFIKIAQFLTGLEVWESMRSWSWWVKIGTPSDASRGPNLK